MRFLLDGMLGKLARWLRMIGYEATYVNDSSDRDLLSLARRNSLVLLTSDEELYRTAVIKGIESFLVKGRTEAERLAGLAERYGLNLRIDATISKCPVCGSVIREIPKQEAEGSVPPTTFKVYRSFWICTNPKCTKIYWQGSHWKKIEQTLESARKILESKTTSRGASCKSRPESRGRQGSGPIGSPGHHKIPVE